MLDELSKKHNYIDALWRDTLRRGVPSCNLLAHDNRFVFAHHDTES